MFKPRNRDRMFKRMVGLFLIGSALALLFFLSSYQQSARAFKKTIDVSTTVDRVDGLAVDAMVSMVGIKIGRVKSIDVTDDNRVLLLLEIDASVSDKLRRDSLATVTRPLIGSGFVDIRIGSPEQPQLALGEAMVGNILPDINDVIASLPAKLVKLDRTLDNLTLMSDDLSRISQAARSGDNSLEKTLANLQSTTRQTDLAAGKLVGTLDETRASIAHIGQVAKTADAALVDIRAGTQQIGPLVGKMDHIVDDALIISRELRSVAPQVSPVLTSGRNAMNEAEDVMFAAKNNILLRGSLAEPVPLPVHSIPR